MKREKRGKRHIFPNSTFKFRWFFTIIFPKVFPVAVGNILFFLFIKASYLVTPTCIEGEISIYRNYLSPSLSLSLFLSSSMVFSFSLSLYKSLPLSPSSLSHFCFPTLLFLNNLLFLSIATLSFPSNSLSFFLSSLSFSSCLDQFPPYSLCLSDSLFPPLSW